jgi:methionyl aminopeptidase
MIKPKTPDMLKKMREAGIIAANARELAGRSIRPGMTTKELDEIVKSYITGQGARPSFLGYRGYPASVCISINDEIVHGIPGERVICEGDIVSIDVGAYYKGFHSDTADTFPVGKVSEQAELLIKVTRECFYKALEFAKIGNRVGDIGHAVQLHAESLGFSPVRVLTGHGVGKELHEEPEVLNFGKPHTGEELRDGMVIAIEPMINAGGHRVKVLEDGWTTKTADGSLSAHYEHTVAITKDGPLLLTAI